MTTKKLIMVAGLICVFILLYFNAYSIITGDLNFFNDVARDFLLLRELDEKKIVLIGPRANSTGLFHGPLWTYMNYPAFLIGHGNPIFVGWFWIILLVIFLVSGYFIASGILFSYAGLGYIMLLASHTTPFINGLFHSLTNFFFIPIFFYTAYMYFKTKKWKYLGFHLCIMGIIVQLNVGIGGSILILTSFLHTGLIIHKRMWKHLLAFFLIPGTLINFILFNLKHNFLMLQPVFSNFAPSRLIIPFESWFRNRIENMISMQLLQNHNINPFHILEIIFVVTVITTIIRIRKREHTLFYGLMLYYYFGYILLLFVNKGIILGHFVFFLIPLTTLWVVSFLEKKYIYIFFPLLLFILYQNFLSSWQYTQYIKNNFSLKDPYSWKTLKTIGERVAEKEKKEPFGYYVFSPDSFAYQPRYAMLYVFQKNNLHAFEYKKMPITYIIASPPPPGDPYMNEVWWIKNQVKITSLSKETEKMPGGYKIIKYSLDNNEISIEHDKNIELGISFR